MLIISTRSGSRYYAEARDTRYGPCLFVRKDGWEHARPAVAIYPDRLPFLEATQVVRWDGRQAIGFNAQGTITLRFEPLQVKRGMILASRHGLRSTEITSVEG